jgi:hypothetical protein
MRCFQLDPSAVLHVMQCSKLILSCALSLQASGRRGAGVKRARSPPVPPSSAQESMVRVQQQQQQQQRQQQQQQQQQQQHAVTNVNDKLPFNREQYVRLMLKSLTELGYTEAATVLEAESKIQLHTPAVRQLCEAVLQGHWDKCILLLKDLSYRDADSRAMAQYLVSSCSILIVAKHSNHR